MTQEEKQLLLKDLCARLPYGVKCAVFDNTLPFGGMQGKYPFEMDGVSIEEDGLAIWLEKGNFNIETIKPYLRPMSSMTEEERKEFHHYASVERNYLGDDKFYTHYQMIDWLNAHHFDYRNLIDKGLALEAPEDMYKTE